MLMPLMPRKLTTVFNWIFIYNMSNFRLSMDSYADAKLLNTEIYMFKKDVSE